MSKVQAKRDFINWIKTEYPFTYEIAMKRLSMQQNEMGAFDSLTKIFDAVADTAKNVAPTFLKYKQQKKLLNIQLERARAGQPPLDATQYTMPPIKVEPVINNETEAAATRIAQKSISESIAKSKWVFFGAIGLGAALFMKMRR